MNQHITCISVGAYEKALTRGKQYESLAYDAERRQWKVRGDSGRARWYAEEYFDPTNHPPPLLVGWRFDEPVIDILNDRDASDNWVEVSVDLSDGSTRWCSFVTPDFLKGLLESQSVQADSRGAEELAVWGNHIITIRDLAADTVGCVLDHLDQQGELIAHSRPLLP